MESSELGSVPKRDGKTLTSELLRPPEGTFEAMADDGRDDPPMIEPIRRAKTENEKRLNGPASTGPDEADHVAILDKLRDAELELGRIKKENAILREENTRLNPT